MANNSEFWERYQDPRWQRKRLEIMQRDEWKCKCCDATGDTLNVHHAYYERDAMPWEYPDSALVTLCKTCHEKKHSQKTDLLTVLAFLRIHETEELIGYGCTLASERGGRFTLTREMLCGVIRYVRAPIIEPELWEEFGSLVGKRVSFEDLIEAESKAGYQIDKVDEWRNQKDLEDLMYAQFAFNG